MQEANQFFSCLHRPPLASSIKWISIIQHETYALLIASALIFIFRFMGKKLKLNPSIRPFPQSASEQNAETAFELPLQFINALHSSNWRICSKQEEDDEDFCVWLCSGASPTTSAAPPFCCFFFYRNCPPIVTRQLVSIGIGHKNVITQHLKKI